MKNFRRSLTLLFLSSLNMLMSRSSLAASFRNNVGYSFATFTKVSNDGTVSGAAPLGVDFSAGYFLADQISADGTFELNLETSQNSAVFAGGGIQLSYYLSGGQPKQIFEETFSAIANPKIITTVFTGAVVKSYNFSAFDKASGRVKKRAANNTLRGSVMGPVFGASGSLNVSERVRMHLTGKIFKGLTDEITPAITNIGFSFGLELLL